MNIFKIITVEGKVSDIRNTVNITGGGDSSDTSTLHISIFNIGTQAVKYSAPTVSIINNENEIVVSGIIWRGVLHSLAYKNFSTGTYDNVGVINCFFGGFICFVVGLVLYFIFSWTFTTIGIGIGIIIGMFPILGILFIVSGFYIKKAFTIVKNTQTKELNV